MGAREIEEISRLIGKRRRFRYIQVGASSRCHLRCAICPRTCFPDGWRSEDMAMGTYTRLAKFFHHAENVYLSGWGEPLLNRHLFDMIRLAKAAGCSVGFTTSGAPLNDAAIDKLVELQTDLIAFSLAGATAATHERLRCGSDFGSLMDSLRAVAAAKEASDSDRPRVLILFMMTTVNMVEVPLVIELAARVAADGVVATNLDYVASPALDEMRAFSCVGARRDVEELLGRAEGRARDMGVSFHRFPTEMSPVSTCSEDPINNLYVSEDGRVSPCVYLSPPMAEIPRIFCGRRVIVPRISFGDVNEQSLPAIWSSREYASFRRKHERRREGLPPEAPEDLPEACRTCFKAYGL